MNIQGRDYSVIPIYYISQKVTNSFIFNSFICMSLSRLSTQRPSSTADALVKLPALFKKNGTVSAGNASGISDGAGCVLIASEEAVKKHNLTPLARIVSYGVQGVDPTIMGIGPVPGLILIFFFFKIFF